jgi:hypothetical protein
MTYPGDLAAWLNNEIAAFVGQASNARLRPGTGAYSAPFRGPLFGTDDRRAVAARLRTRRVDVLWFGSNPRVPQSVAQIVHGATGAGDFHEFTYQWRSDLFGSVRWTADGQPRGTFNPLGDAPRFWYVYRDAFDEAFGSVDGVAMANAFPWGSRNMTDLGRQVRAADPLLWNRMVAFVDFLTRTMIRTLRPRLLLLPYSLDTVTTLRLTLRATDARVVFEQPKLTVRAGTYRDAALAVPALYGPHPSYFQYVPKASRQQLEKRLPRIIRALLARTPSSI